MKKRITALFLCVLMLVSLFPASALALNTEETDEEIIETENPAEKTEKMSEEPLFEDVEAEAEEKNTLSATASYSGTCGKNLTWSLNSSGVLTISGTGEMYNYSINSSGSLTTSAPWGKYYASIKTVVIANGVTSIGEYAFAWCSCLSSVIIRDSVTSIGKMAFYFCDGLSSVTIGNGVTSIGVSAFDCCSSLTSVTIPDSVTSIGYGAFACSSLSSIVVDDGNKKYHSAGNCLIETASKTLIAGCKNSVIPSDGSVTSIGTNAFRHNENLSSVVIPDSVTSIGAYAFIYCFNLGSVTIGTGVTSIGDSAFFYCDSLKDVYYTGTQEQWNKISIGKSNDPLTSATIHYNSVPAVDKKKAIIVIPGITGSELFDKETLEKYWAPMDFGKVGTVDTLVAMTSLLFCDENGDSIHDIMTMDDSFRPYGTQDTYKNIVTALRNKYDSKYGGSGEYDVRFFPYDWRLTNSKSAAALDEFIHGNGYDEVVLVAHSMGGIVASYCAGAIASDDYIIDKLITLGTPFYGAAKAYGAFCTGQFIENKLSYPFVKILAAHNICGLFELLPNSRYFGSKQNNNPNYNNYLIKYDGKAFDYNESVESYKDEDWFNNKLYTQAENLFGSLYSVYDKMLSGEIDFYGIVGYNVNTIEGYTYTKVRKGGRSPGYRIISDVITDNYGDGTVPLASATMGYADGSRSWYYVNETNHNDLVKTYSSIKLVSNIIDGKGDTNDYNKNCSNMVSRSIGTVKTLSGYKVIASCPVDVSVYDKTGNLLGTISENGISAADGHEFDFYYCGENNEIKIAFIDEDADIVVNGTGSGVMDLRIEKIEDDAVVEEKAFIDVPITETTVITSNISENVTPTLILDASGDGTTETVIEPNKAHNDSHKVLHYEATEATCTQNARCEYWHCEDCGRYFWDEECTDETKVDFVTESGLLPHTLSELIVDATCTNEGYTKHTCTVCGYSYMDNYTDPLNHAYGEAVFDWVDDLSSCTVTIVCANNADHVLSGNATVTSEVTTVPSCETEGVLTYTASITLNGTDYTDTMTDTIPATGHTCGAPEFTWSGYTCTAKISCGCGYSEPVQCTVTSEVTKEPTTISTGVRKYTATAVYNGAAYTSNEHPTETVPKVDRSTLNVGERIVSFIKGLFSWLH